MLYGQLFGSQVEAAQKRATDLPIAVNRGVESENWRRN